MARELRSRGLLSVKIGCRPSISTEVQRKLTGRLVAVDKKVVISDSKMIVSTRTTPLTSIVDIFCDLGDDGWIRSP